VGDGAPVAAKGDARPDELHDSEGPGTGEESVRARQQAAERERQKESAMTSFQGVHRHHEGQSANSVDRYRRTRHPCQSSSDSLLDGSPQVSLPWLSGPLARFSGSLLQPRLKAVVGSRATAFREPSQRWKPAALSELCWVPRIAWPLLWTSAPYGPPLASVHA
jgi:hypothetical protein